MAVNKGTRTLVLVPLFTAINLYCLMDLGDVRGCKWFIRFYYGLYVVTVVSVLRVFVFNFCYLRCVPMSNVLRIRFIFYINKKMTKFILGRNGVNS